MVFEKEGNRIKVEKWKLRGNKKNKILKIYYAKERRNKETCNEKITVL